MEERQIVSFSIDKQAYGIDILNIREIIKIPDHITELAGSSGEVKGVINLRGDIIPIIDIREKFLNRELTIDKKENRIIICEIKDDKDKITCVGYIVDDVDKVLRIPPEDIELPGDVLKNQGIDVICKLEDQMIILLDSKNVIENYVDNMKEVQDENI